MKIERAKKLIMQFEGLRLNSYRCPAGVWTIGYGHTKGVKANQTITKEEAGKLLEKDLAAYQKKVDKYDHIYHFTEPEYNALLSFAFNIGSIDQLTANGTRPKEVIANKMLLYVKASGKVLPGLVKRRQIEHDLFVEV